eukprot:1217708-Alexandrium_andersonii.AAC.1
MYQAPGQTMPQRLPLGALRTYRQSADTVAALDRWADSLAAPPPPAAEHARDPGRESSAPGAGTARGPHNETPPPGSLD